MKITLARAMALLLALAFNAVAEDAADAILTRYFAATGAAAAGVTETATRISTGTLQTPGGSLALTLQQKAPDRVLLELRFPKGTVRRGYDGVAGWESSTISGNRAMPAPEQKAFTEEYALASRSPKHILARFPKREALSHKQLRMTQSDGNSETWTFDPATHFLTGIQRELDGGPHGMVQVTIALEEYKKVGDLMLPHTIRSRTSQSETLLRLDTIRQGEPLADALFAGPAGTSCPQCTGATYTSK